MVILTTDILKALNNFVRNKKTTKTYGNQSMYYINGEKRDSNLKQYIYMNFVIFLFQSNAIFLKQVQTLTVQYKGAFKPNLLPVSFSLWSTCFGKQLEACQEKVIDLCLKKSSQLYTVRAYYKHNAYQMFHQLAGCNPRDGYKSMERCSLGRHLPQKLHKHPLANLFTEQHNLGVWFNRLKCHLVLICICVNAFKEIWLWSVSLQGAFSQLNAYAITEVSIICMCKELHVYCHAIISLFLLWSKAFQLLSFG